MSEIVKYIGRIKTMEYENFLNWATDERFIFEGHIASEEGLSTWEYRALMCCKKTLGADEIIEVINYRNKYGYEYPAKHDSRITREMLDASVERDRVFYPGLPYKEPFKGYFKKLGYKFELEYTEKGYDVTTLRW